MSFILGRGISRIVGSLIFVVLFSTWSGAQVVKSTLAANLAEGSMPALGTLHAAPISSNDVVSDQGQGQAGASGRVAGTVKDTAGAVLQGAQVILQPIGITVVSNSQGAYLIPSVKPGTYTLSISYVGFATSVDTITVSAGQTTTQDETLSVSASNQQVEVNANLEGD